MLVSTRSASTGPFDPEAPSRPRRRGATVMEYALMLSLIVIVCLISISYLGGENSKVSEITSSKISDSLKNSGVPSGSLGGIGGSGSFGKGGSGDKGKGDEKEKEGD